MHTSQASSLRKLAQSTHVQAVKSTPMRGHTKSLPSSAEMSEIASKFRFSAGEARKMMTDLQLKSTRQLLRSLLEPASKLARPPISQFHVGAVGMTPSGNIYVGVNMEFPNIPLNNSVHAEQFLIANLKNHGETELSVVAVNAAPCGHCRQFFSELQCADSVEFVFGENEWRSYKLHDLLPMRFKPQDLLGDDPPPLLLSPQNRALTYTVAAKETIAQQTDSALFQQGAQLALQEAQQSYCPYSNCPAGVALITKDGEVYGGGYMESCAYNPSMQALQSALVHSVIGGVPEYTNIEEVIVAEGFSKDVSHTRGAKLLMSSISPSARVCRLDLEQVGALSA